MTISCCSRCKRYIACCSISSFTCIRSDISFRRLFSSIDSICYVFSSCYTISGRTCNCAICTSRNRCGINSNFHPCCRSRCAHKTAITGHGKGYVPVFKVFITCGTSVSSEANPLSSSINCVSIQTNRNRLIINSRRYAISTSYIKFLVFKVHSAVICTISNIKILR